MPESTRNLRLLSTGLVTRNYTGGFEMSHKDDEIEKALEGMRKKYEETKKKVDEIVGPFTGKLGTREYREYLRRRHEARKNLK
jgi:hypothetical protein